MLRGLVKLSLGHFHDPAWNSQRALGWEATIGEPDDESLAAELSAEFEALDVMLDGLAADSGICVRKRTEFVRVLLAGMILVPIAISKMKERRRAFLP